MLVQGGCRCFCAVVLLWRFVAGKWRVGYIDIYCMSCSTILSNNSLWMGFLFLVNDSRLMFIGPCVFVIVEEQKTNLMSLVILFHFLCTQHVSDINISVIRSLWLCCWITTSVVLFSEPRTKDRCGNSTSQSQGHDDGYINVRNMLST